MSNEGDNPPNLQEWVAKYGGYNKIPWREWDEANYLWQLARKEKMATSNSTWRRQVKKKKD